jgi:hypothetical protein
MAMTDGAVTAGRPERKVAKMSASIIGGGTTRRRGFSSRLRVVIVTLGLASFALPVPASVAHSGHGSDGHAVSGTAVRAWNEIAVNTLIGLPPAAGGAPSASAVHVAMVQAAVFDAVNAITPKHYRPYLLKKRFSPHASTDAAVAAAAYGVLQNIVSTVPNIPDAARAATLATLATQYVDALAAVTDGKDETAGVAAGEAAAAAMNADREDDGRFGPSQWVPNTAAGHWSPQINPANGQPILDPTPWVGGVTPFVLTSPSQFRGPGPSQLTSDTYAMDFNEVKTLGAINSTVRTPEQTYIARWWQSNPVKSWNEVSRELAMRNDLDALQTARLLALQNLSGADASIGCWNDKYHWDFWRPWNAIPRAAEDNNPATEPDATWLPLISAPYPENPSGHLCQDGANTTILRMFFGDWVEGGFSITSISTFLQPADVRVRHFDSFSQALDELVEARIWAGLHFRTADLQGKALGTSVARYVVCHELQPVGHDHFRHRR